MSRPAFEQLDRTARGRALARSGARISATVAVFAVLYWVTPIAGEEGARALGRFVAGVVVLAAVLAWQIRATLSADHPVLRGIEALATSIAVLIVVFAFTYLSLSTADAHNFSEPLNRVDALYFTVTVLSTVGFGDIVARTDAARLLVTVQILLDIVIVAGVVRLVVLAARLGAERQRAR